MAVVASLIWAGPLAPGGDAGSVPNSGDQRASVALVSSTFEWDQSIAFDGDGFVHVVFSRSVGARPGLYYVTNRGSAWSAVRLTTSAVSDEARIHVDAANKVHIVWWRSYDAQPGIYYTTNVAGTWKTTKLVASDNIPSGFGSALDANGRLHIIFAWRLISGPLEIRYLTNVGGSFKSVRIFDGTFDAPPAVVVSPSGKVSFAFQVYECCATTELWFASNRSGTWSKLQVPGATRPESINLALDSSGAAHIVYMEAYYTEPGLIETKEVAGHWVEQRRTNRYLTGLDLLTRPNDTFDVVGLSDPGGSNPKRQYVTHFGDAFDETIAVDDLFEKGPPAAALDSAGGVHIVHTTTRTGRWAVEYLAPDGETWTTVFDGDSFLDTAGTFKTDIDWLIESGITAGCAPSFYCPSDFVTREQMASFLARALGLTGTPIDAFTDDEMSSHELSINRLAAAGLTTGCGGGKFCPTGLVTREQMASFLARALDLSGPAPDAFTDDELSTHETAINLVARDGITTGCAPTKYCPIANVTRGQMAAFLHRAFGP